MTNDNTNVVYIQQLKKYCKENKKWNEIFPVTFIQAIYNAANGNRLDTLLAMYNSIFVEYKGSFATTVAAIDNIVRKKGLIITYFDENNLSWTRRYKLHDVSDINFQNEDNWEGYNFDILIDEIYKDIEYIFSNIDKFPDLKNVLIQQITEVIENIFNNIEDYANLYNIFKILIKENINNVFNNINDYSEFKNLINTNINNRIDYIFNNIDDFEILLNKINVAILNRVDYIFNNINKYPELKQLIINSLQAKQLFTIEFSVNRDTLDIINKDELNSYIENNNINNALVTFIGKFFDASNNKLIYNLVFTAFVNTNSNYLNLDNCYGETLIINNGKLYKYKINFNIDTETEMSDPNWITYARKYDDIPTFEFNYISTNVYSIADIDDYNKYVNSFKINTLVRFIFNESSTVINEYIGYINKIGSTLRILIYLQENNGFIYNTIISGIIENNELRINRLSNSDILTYLYNANSSGGVVLLDDETLIPSRFLPSYVDDVIDLLGGIIEITPTSGMTAGYKYYVTSTKKIFTASSATSGITSDPVSDVIYVVPDDTNGAIMYRWSGTNLVEIVNGGIVIGTTTGTAFEGNRGLQAEKDIDKLQSYINNGVVSNVESSNNVAGEIKVTRRIKSGNTISTSEQYIALPQSSSSKDGLMSSSDKVKLDNIIIIKLTGTDLTFVDEDTDINSVKNTNIDITEFDGILESLNSGKNVKIYINEYNDGTEQTFNINCDIAFNYNSREIFIQYDIYDLNKRIYASLYEDGDRVSLEILAVKNKYTKFYYIDSNILYNPTKGQSSSLSATQFSIQQFDELVSDIQKRKDFCVYAIVHASKNSNVKYYKYIINCIVNSNTQLLCNYINPLDNSYVKFIMNKNTANVEIIINQKYNIINTVDVLNTVMSGLVLKPTSGNQFETNQRYSSSDTLIQLINKFIQNSGYNDFRIVHSPTTINFVFGTTIDHSNSVVNVLSFVSNLNIGTPKINVYTKTINFTEVAELTYSELNTLIRDGTWQTFSLDLTTIGGSGYTLPTASSTTLGGIKIPSNGQLTIDNNGNLYPNVATANSAGIVKPAIDSGLFMNDSSISVTLGRRDINLGVFIPGGTINGGRYYVYDDTVAGNASFILHLNNNINSWQDPLAIIIVNRTHTGGIRFDGTNVNMLTYTNDCTKLGAIFIRYFQNNNENGYFVWAIPKIIQ